WPPPVAPAAYVAPETPQRPGLWPPGRRCWSGNGWRSPVQGRSRPCLPFPEPDACRGFGQGGPGGPWRRGPEEWVPGYLPPDAEEKLFSALRNHRQFGGQQCSV